MATKSNEEAVRSENEVGANELLELLAGSKTADRAESLGGNDFLLSTELLVRMAEQHRRGTVTLVQPAPSVAPPPRRRSALATVAALTVALAALGLVLFQTLDAPAAAAAELGRAGLSVPATPAPVAATTPVAPIAEYPEEAAPVDEFTLDDIAAFDADGATSERSRRDRDTVAQPAAETGSASGIDENPYAAVAVATTPIAPAAPAVTPASEVDDLIESALSRPTRTRASSSETANLLPHETFKTTPEKPSRQQVRQVMNRLLSGIRACGGETYDRLVVRMTVIGETGRVTAAETVDSTYAGTAVGTCAARVAKMAKFPRFTQDELVVKYPFEL